MRLNGTARRWLATALLILILVMVTLSLALTVGAIRHGDGAAVYGVGFASLILGGSFAVVGWLVATRQSDNPLGWVYLGIGLSQVGLAFADDAAAYGLVSNPGSIPFADLLSWVTTWAWAPGFFMLISFSLLLFPDGHLLSPRWRPVAWLGVVSMPLAAIPNAIAAWPLRGVALLGAWGDIPGMLGLIAMVGLLTIPVVAVASVASIVVRFRRSTGQERLQLKWFTFAAVIVIAFVVPAGFNLLDPAFITVFVGIFVAPLLPIAIGIAILRYRLYEIDRIVSRTIAYAVVTAVLAATFVGAILVLEAVLATFTQGQTIAVAASTLAVFALFQPVRRRVQRAVDRRFNRSRYDGERIAEAFAGRLRDQVDLGELRADVLDAVDGALQPGHRTLWLRGGD